MTKRELMEKLAGQIDGLTLHEAETVINTIFHSMTDALASGDRIEIRGFGSFMVKEQKAREARNPRTGEKVNTKAKKKPFFKPAKELRKRVDG